MSVSRGRSPLKWSSARQTCCVSDVDNDQSGFLGFPASCRGNSAELCSVWSEPDVASLIQHGAKPLLFNLSHSIIAGFVSNLDFSFCFLLGPPSVNSQMSRLGKIEPYACSLLLQLKPC